MLTIPELLQPLHAHRTDEVVVTTMSVTRPWGLMSDSDLDFASADSAMGHATDLALGIALARPDRTVISLNGDGSMLMTLGTLATITGSGASNLLVIVVNNGVYEVTGHQRVPGPGPVDYAAMGRAAGFPRVLRADDPGTWTEAVPALLAGPGPILVDALVQPSDAGPVVRGSHEACRYLQTSLADWSRTLRAALAADL